ncbi:MAG: hypothetical protein LBI17_02855 [Rickettsiales bacterium]|jgi:hypothetical protein|nr:hypothetical protein [Rickettsiales bacterium]
MPKFDKEKLPNYILCAILAIVALILMRKTAMGLWRFDFARAKHLLGIGRLIITGKVLFSAKYLSFLAVMAGIATAFFGLGSIALAADLKKFMPKKPKAEEKEKEKPAKSVSSKPKAKKAAVQTAQDVPIEVRTYHPRAAAAYAQVDPEVARAPSPAYAAQPAPQPAALYNPAPPSMDEVAERENLQKKIHEIMDKMKAREDVESAAEQLATAAQPAGRILTPAKFDVPPARKASKMNFADIPPAANSEIEHFLIGANLKLLSEIRIGETGIDYIGVGDAINVIQCFAPEGSWMASEDSIGGGAPVWFSEDRNRTSPVARAIEAKYAVESLIRGKIDLPVRAYACMADGSVVNASDMEEEWKRLGVGVMRLDSNTSEAALEPMGAIFPPNSQPEIAEERMQELISILEAAESPA